MAVRRRGTAWQADVFIFGKRKRLSFGSKEEAEAWASVSATGHALRKGKTKQAEAVNGVAGQFVQEPHPQEA